MYRAQPPASPDDIDIAALGRAVWAQRGLVAALAITAGVLTYVALSFMTPLYTSEARILINNEETAFTRPANTTSLDSTPAKPDAEAVASQVQVLLSRDLALEVVRELKLTDNREFNKPGGLLALPRTLLRSIGLLPAPSQASIEERALSNFSRNLSVYQIASSRVISVAFTSQDPETAAEVANALAQAYLRWQQQEKLRQTRDASRWLEEQIAELRKRVQESEANAEDFRSKNGLFAGQNNVTLDAQQLSELNSQLILAKAQRTEAEARAALIEKTLRENGDVDASPDVLRSELIQRLLEQRVQVQRQLAELSATRMPSHPSVRQLQAELAGVRRQIRDEVSKIVTSLRNEAQIAGAREASLRESLNDLKQNSAASNENQIKLRALEREAKANRDLLESYLARYRDASARRDELSAPADASIISRAHASSTPSFPKKVPYSILATIAVTLLSLAYILARELIRGQGASEPQGPQRHVDVAASRFSSSPVSAAVSLPSPSRLVPVEAPPVTSGSPVSSAAPIPVVARPALTTDATPASPAAIVHHLLGRLDQSPRQRIMILGSGVDATREAIDLARQLAKATERVALVDLTTRGTLASRLDLPPVPGIRELVAGRANFEHVVRLDPASAVQVFANGNPRLGSIIEDSDGLRRVLNALDEAYACTLALMDEGTARTLAGPGNGDWDVAVVVAGTKGAQAPVPLDKSIDVIRCARLNNEQPTAQSRHPFSRLPFMRRPAASMA